MSRASSLVLVLILAGCKGKEDKAPASAPPPVAAKASPVDAAIADAPAPGVLAFEAADSPDQPPSALGVAFGARIPRLPAVSADDRELAAFDSLATGPWIPEPMQLVVTALATGAEAASLPILTAEEATSGTSGASWVTPAIRKKLEARAAPALARLRGFRSLEPLELASGKPTKLGELALWTMEDDKTQRLVVELRNGKGAILQRAEIEPYDHGTMPGAIPCHYSPLLNEAYRDPVRPMIYLRIRFRFHEDCDPPQVRDVAWSLDPAAASPVESIRDVVTRQFDLVGVNGTEQDEIVAPGADAIGVDLVGSADHLKPLGVVDHAMDLNGHDDKDVAIAISRDGKSAWASETTSLTILEPNTPGRDAPWRASDVLVKTPKGWRIAALAWTEPRANADVNREAKAGKLAAGELAGPADAGLQAAFASLTTAGLDATAGTRADLVAIGSGPGERTVGGAIFGRAWNAGWKGKVAIVSSIARALPGGTTGWVAATIDLAKPGFKIPFTVFCIFDKDAAGAWSLVHIQLAVGRAT